MAVFIHFDHVLIHTDDADNAVYWSAGTLPCSKFTVILNHFHVMSYRSTVLRAKEMKESEELCETNISFVYAFYTHTHTHTPPWYIIKFWIHTSLAKLFHNRKKMQIPICLDYIYKAWLYRVFTISGKKWTCGKK